MKNTAPTALVILDGFGYRKEDDYNAVAQASMPHFSYLLSSYPGNSEVGHLTLGCGAIIKQPFTLIEEAIIDGSFYQLPTLKKLLQNLKKSDKKLHLMGLLSDGGVHSSINHLFAFLKMAHQEGLTKVIIHPFLDGRDVDPHSASRYIEMLEEECKKYRIGTLGTLHGRFYAMDRNRNWQQTERSYRVLTEKQPPCNANWKETLKKTYAEQPSEEFFTPIQLNHTALIEPEDGLIFFNFRPDRARQLTSFFLNGYKPAEIKPLKLAFFVTPVSYGPDYKTTLLFKKSTVQQTLTEFLHTQGYSIFSIAETEKYAHVTYFFNGGREKKLEHETRILVPSTTLKNYDKYPEMGADTITQAIVESLTTRPDDFYVINYANADMVGHTGNFQATLKALECLDRQLGILVHEIVQKRNGVLYITGDHGNAEDMYDEVHKEPRTSHTTNPVFFVMVAQDLKGIHTQLPLTQLSDVAPFIAHVMLEGIQTSLR